jgi:hypothetical protein
VQIDLMVRAFRSGYYFNKIKMLKKIYQLFKSGSAEVDAPRTVILHGHIFKNAGSTFDWSLERNFGAGFCDHRDDMDMRKGGADYLAGYLAVNSTLNALSSHHLCSSSPKVDGVKIVPCYFFRHPIARVRSVYDFEHKQPEETPGSIHAKKYNFEEYVSWRMRMDVNPTIRDYQLRYCLPKSYDFSAIDEETYGLVTQRLAESALIGVVERYDESIVVFEESLREYFPELDLSYVIQNIGANGRSNRTAEEKASEVLRDLGEGSDALLAENQYDLALYEFCNKELDKRVSQISGFDRKLIEFKERCNRL